MQRCEKLSRIFLILNKNATLVIVLLNKDDVEAFQ